MKKIWNIIKTTAQNNVRQATAPSSSDRGRDAVDLKVWKDGACLMLIDMRPTELHQLINLRDQFLPERASPSTDDDRQCQCHLSLKAKKQWESMETNLHALVISPPHRGIVSPSPQSPPDR